MTFVDLDYRNPDLEDVTHGRFFRWHTLAVGRVYFRQIDENNFVVDSVLLRGDVSLFVCCTAETPKEVLADFFPILIKKVDANFIEAHTWDVVASLDCPVGLGARLGWLFDEPSIRLIETTEIIGPPIDRPHEASFRQKFYHGLEITNKTDTSRLRLIVSQDADFLMSMQLVAC